MCDCDYEYKLLAIPDGQSSIMLGSVALCKCQYAAANVVEEGALYSLSTRVTEEAIIAKQEANRARQEAQKILKERDEKLDRMHQALSHLVETRRTALGLIMNLDSQAIQFDFDKAILKTANRELLSKIAGILLTSKGYHIFVYGHTDDVGSVEYNQQLSERRALTVRDYLI